MKVVATQDVARNENGPKTSWRLLNPETLGTDFGAKAGLIEYGYQDDIPDEDLGHAHDHPEYCYVITGKGVLATPGERTSLTGGSAFAIPPGVPHSIWSESQSEDLQAFYVSLNS